MYLCNLCENNMGLKDNVIYVNACEGITWNPATVIP
jgi:hypothetical protein